MIIILNRLGKPQPGKTKKAAGGGKQPFINFLMSLSAPTSSLYLIPLCIPLVMRQSCGSLCNLICISKKQAHCTLRLQLCFSISSLLQPSILFSFTRLYFFSLSVFLSQRPSFLLSSSSLSSSIDSSFFVFMALIQTQIQFPLYLAPFVFT